jgi:hypothetical protein
MKLLALATLIQFELGCKRKTHAQFIFSQYKLSDTFHGVKNFRPDSISYSKGYKAYLEYDRNGNLYEAHGDVGKHSKDSIIFYGHVFIIDTIQTNASNDKYGRLLSYIYIGTNTSPYSYGIKFNRLTQKYVEVFTPFLDYFIYSFSQKDSVLKYTFHFAGFPRSIIKASYSYDNNNYKDLAIDKSNFMPFLEQANLKINKNVDHIFLKTEAKDLELDLPGISNHRTFLDTVKLYKALSTF